VAEEWFEANRARWSASTKHNYRNVLDRHLYPLIGGRALSHLTAGDLERALDTVATTSPSMAIMGRRMLSAMYGHAVRYGHLATSPITTMRARPQHAPLPRYLTADEYALILRVATGDTRDAAVVAVRTGLRQGELVALRGEDWQGSRLVIVRAWDRLAGRMALPKSRKPRSVPVHPDVAKILRRRVKVYGDGLIWGHSRAGRWRWWSDRWYWMGRGLELPTGTHLFRHTFAAWWVQAGGGMRELQRILGHASVKTTEIYAHLAPDSVELAAGKLWGRLGTRGDGPRRSKRRGSY
jgi:integrase